MVAEGHDLSVFYRVLQLVSANFQLPPPKAHLVMGGARMLTRRQTFAEGEQDYPSSSDAYYCGTQGLRIVLGSCAG